MAWWLQFVMVIYGIFVVIPTIAFVLIMPDNDGVDVSIPTG
jgi:hypothetical protein